MKLHVVGLALLLSVVTARAEVIRIEVTSRTPFASGAVFGSVGAYEKVRGRLTYAVDPTHPANAAIVDLKLAPRDAQGRVVFTGDFLLLKPQDLARGNHRLLYDVNNRGNLGILARLNRGRGSNDPETVSHAGNAFLMREGYSILWSAWNWDVVPGNDRLQIDLPVATENGRPITGTVVAEIVVDQRTDVQPVAWGNSRGYEVADAAAQAAARLTARDEQASPRVEVPRARWRFSDPTHVQLDGGFEPGRLYELVYTAKDPRVVGLGLAAIRDAIAFFRFVSKDGAGTPNPLARAAADESATPDAEKALIFGISQSGRVIQHMLFQGFHVDEAGRMTFEGAMPHVSGAGKGSFNHRFAQTTRHPSEWEDHQYPADFFPFTTMPDTDPVTGETGDVLAVAKSMGKVPRIMYTGTSTEYWTRAASLLHTNAAGTADAPVDERVRIYFIAGAQHAISNSDALLYEHVPNLFDHSPPMRALLLALDRWVTDGTAPPESRYPRIDRDELVPVAAWAARFPKIPHTRLPRANLQPPRVDWGPRFRSAGLIERQPPVFGAPYVALVPAPDADGNDRGGIRLPEVAVPLGTYSGWNLRKPAMGASNHLARWSGSWFHFAPTEGTRKGDGDPRPSLWERYRGREDYAARVSAAVRQLQREGFLLEEDAHAAVAAAYVAWPMPDR